MTTRSLLIIMTAIMLSGAASGKDPFTKKELANGLTKRATLKLADRYYAESSILYCRCTKLQTVSPAQT